MHETFQKIKSLDVTFDYPHHKTNLWIIRIECDAVAMSSFNIFAKGEVCFASSLPTEDFPSPSGCYFVFKQ